MKTSIVSLILLVLLLVLPSAAQDSSGTIDTASPGKTIILNDTTVALAGPSGTGTSPTVLQVIGGNGQTVDCSQCGTGQAGGGGGIQLSSGSGGAFCFPTSTRCEPASGGRGASIFALGGGAGRTGHGGIGGSITLQPGAAGSAFGSSGPPGNVLLLLPTGGALGVGTSNPAATLDVAAGGTTLADAWTTRSSRRFKTNIQPLEGALEKVEQLQGVTYERKLDGKQEIGVVAEDVAQIVPEVVSRDPNTHEVQGVDYSRLAVLLIEAIKSQQAEIQELKARLTQRTSPAPGQ